MDTSATISFLFIGIPIILDILLLGVSFAIGFASGMLYEKLKSMLEKKQPEKSEM